MKVIYRAITVTIRLTTADTMVNTLVPFPDQPALQGAWITGIEALDNYTLFTALDGTPVISLADSRNILVNLSEGNTVRHRNMNFQQLNPVWMIGPWKELVPFRIDWQKSGIRILNVLSAPLLAVPFVFHYILPGDVANFPK